MFADTNESETVFAPVIQAGVEAFKVSHRVTSVSMKWEMKGLCLGAVARFIFDKLHFSGNSVSQSNTLVFYFYHYTN